MGSVYIGLPPRNMWRPIIARQFMDRAATCQLNVAMTGEDLIEESYDLVLEALPRAKTFDFTHLNQATGRQFEESSARIVVSFLWELGLGWSQSVDGLLETLSCPNLTSLHLYEIHGGQKLPPFPVLQTLTMMYAYYPVASIHSLLQQTPDIRDLSFDNVANE